MKLSITERLLAWHDADFRALPWKSTRDPYKIWLSEVILQQTRVQQGTPYYLKFVNRFPDVDALASADLDEVLKLWEGLGYYSRARNLHIAAKQVVEEYNGIFPDNYQALLKLKGIGEYTAAAIASFAYDEPVAVVDGNVFRVLSRLFGVSDPVDSTVGKKRFRKLAADVLNKKDPASHNQAIMDFGALVCLPKNPCCEVCPFVKDCVANNDGRISMLPYKSKSIEKRTRVLHFYIIHDGQHLIIEQRKEKDIWNGLHQFPLWESTGVEPQDNDIDDPVNEFIKKAIETARSVETYKWYKQTLSHQNIKASFTLVTVEEAAAIERPHGWKVISEEELMRFAFPRIIHKFLQENGDILLHYHLL